MGSKPSSLSKLELNDLPWRARMRMRAKSALFAMFGTEQKGAFKRSLERVVELECMLASKWAASAHDQLMAVQHRIPPIPASFDHHIDLYSVWLKTRNPMWVERGVFTSLCLKGGAVLELACGDGFNARNFYSLKSGKIIACDLDADVIATARRKNPAPNVEYLVCDIRRGLPSGTFDNIVWDYGFPFRHHFSDNDMHAILARVHDSLAADGILSGHTTISTESPRRELHEELMVKRMLYQQLRAHFSSVLIFKTTSPARINVYFWASDGTVPFDTGWSNAYRA
jgi:SAM-dependent methyltransferase